MIDPTTMAVSAGALISGLGLRDLFARAVIKRSCKDAVADIEKFKQDNVYAKPITEEFRAVASILKGSIEKSHEMRETLIKMMREMKTPRLDNALNIPDFEKEMAHNQSVFFRILKETYSYKAQHVFREQVEYRLKKAKGVALKKAAKMTLGAAGTTAATDATAGSAETYQEISKQVAPHLDALDKVFVDFLDKTGVMDFSVDIASGIQDFMHENLKQSTVEHIGAISHFGSDLAAMPGFLSGVRSVFNELDMLMSDTTNMGDAFANGAIPIVLKSMGVKVGLILDAATLGASCGAFTFLGSLAGSLASNTILEEKNAKLRARLQELKEEIDRSREQTAFGINKSAHDFEESFSKKIEGCPDIDEEPSLEAFLDKLIDTYNDGLKTSEEQLSANTKKAIANIPENSMLEKMLFIDRQGAVKRLYLEAQREITSHHIGIVHGFSVAAQTHLIHAVDFLIDHVAFDTPEMTKVLGEMEQAILDSSDGFTKNLSQWETDTLAFRKDGIETIEKTVKTEGDRHREFVAARKPTMSSIARQINANNRRQNKQPSFAAA